jgi:CheY-like chemotaxis protein/DNA-binding XRE family transcriptional regulator
MTSLEVRKAFGAAIREQRLRLGLSQELLGERAELHRTYITDVERGARNLSLESITKLAQALQVPLGSLFSLVGIDRDGALTAVEPPRGGQVSLLLVEDDPKDIELTAAAFQHAHLANHLQISRDGEDALDYLFARGAYARKPPPLPAIVLLDLALPKVHGMEVLRRIKMEERTRKICVVVLTGSRNDSFLQEALRLGADAYLLKPVDFNSFSAMASQFDFSWALQRKPLRPDGKHLFR